MFRGIGAGGRGATPPPPTFIVLGTEPLTFHQFMNIYTRDQPNCARTGSISYCAWANLPPHFIYCCYPSDVGCFSCEALASPMQSGHVEELYSPCHRCRRLCFDRRCKVVRESLLCRKSSVALLAVGERSEHYWSSTQKWPSIGLASQTG